MEIGPGVCDRDSAVLAKSTWVGAWRCSKEVCHDETDATGVVGGFGAARGGGGVVGSS